MDNTRYSYDIVSILQDICSQIKTATNVHTSTSRPMVNSKQREEMIVVGCPYTIRQKGPYQTAYIRIEVIVKDRTEGASNLPRLSQLANKLQELFPLGSTSGRYYTGIPSLYLSGHDTIGFTIWNLQCSLTINKTDSY